MSRHSQRGFSLVEVLVALVITSVGLLGIAKLQAVSYASTGTSSERSLAAIEASSMIAAIRANRAYWSTAPTPLTVTVTRGTVTSPADPSLANPGYVCEFGAPSTNAPCTPAQLAAVDLHTWATSLQGGMTGSASVQGLTDAKATITCPTPATGPVTCAVKVEWLERIVGVDAQSRNAVTSMTSTNNFRNFTLYVVP